MSNCCRCCSDAVSGGGGIAVLVGGIILAVVYMQVIVTFLIMLALSLVLLTVMGVGAILFLQKFIVPKVGHFGGRQTLSATMRQRDNVPALEGKIVKGGIIGRMGKALEAGGSGGRRASAEATAETYEGLPVNYKFEENARSEPLPLRDRLRRL